MKIIKRNGAEVVFDIDKIIMAVTKANDAVDEKVRMTPLQIERISQSVQIACEEMGRSPSVEEIQDLVEKAIMAHGAFEVAKEYITYRYTRSLLRQSNTTDDRILSLIECNNEEVKQENANKNPTINAVQRDYMAGEVSKDITSRILLPKEVVDAHEAGIIHFHDADYYAQHMHNCDLVNLEDMLQNGTVISGTLIEKPHSFSTACNIATQIIAQVASNQYGGQSISLTHLAPFVQVSREKIRKTVEREMAAFGVAPAEETISKVVEDRLREEVRRGVQTIQYQVVTLMTTNGQAPFITVFMYLGEARNDTEQRLSAGTVDNRLVHTTSDGSAEHIDDFHKHVEVAVRQNVVRYRDEPGDFEAVQLHGIECELHLVHRAFHLRPDRFRRGRNDHLPRLALDRLVVYILDELRVLLDLFPDGIQHLGRNAHFHTGYGALFAGTDCPDFREKFLYIFAPYTRSQTLAQFVFTRGGSSFHAHVLFTSTIFFGFAAGVLFRRVFADFGQLFFQPVDLRLCFGNLRVQTCLFYLSLQCGKVALDRVHVCVRGGGGVRETLFDGCLAFLECFALSKQFRERPLCLFQHEIHTELFQHFSFPNLSLMFFTAAARRFV